MKALGPSFGTECIAAGLGGLPFSWGEDDQSFFGRDQIMPAQNATLDAVIAAHIAHQPTIDEIYDATILQQRVLKAVVLAINDGTLTVGGNRTPAQLKAIIKAKM